MRVFRFWTERRFIKISNFFFFRNIHNIIFLLYNFWSLISEDWWWVCGFILHREIIIMNPMTCYSLFTLSSLYNIWRKKKSLVHLHRRSDLTFRNRVCVLRGDTIQIMRWVIQCFYPIIHFITHDLGLSWYWDAVIFKI